MNQVRVSSAAIAMNRFGLGAQAGQQPPAQAAHWLRDQLEATLAQATPAVWASQPMTPELAGQVVDFRRTLQQLDGKGNDATNDQHSGKQGGKQNGAMAENPLHLANAAPVNEDQARSLKVALRQQYNATMRDVYRDAVDARLLGALTTSTPFVERLVYFWANHFAVSVEKQPVALFAGAFEVEAIRPHVLGRFDDMLVAVEQHPAMLFFLDQNGSIGPDSPVAERAEARAQARDLANVGGSQAANKPTRKVGLNENLARETMELHTLGVRSGYTQNDVTEFARTLTGWTVGGLNPNIDAAQQRNKRAGVAASPVTPGQFMFRPQVHEPGIRTIMGEQYAQQGEDQGLAALGMFARSPATAHHIAEKLAVHFVSDNPPPALINQLAKAFQDSDGDLPTVYRALIDAPDAWQPVNAKFKTPWDWTVSSMRGLGMTQLGKVHAGPVLTQLGQPIWRPGSPAGYDDIAASWAAPDALVRRVAFAQRLAAGVGDRIDARTLGPQLFAGSLSEDTRNQVARAESAQDALALLLVSPDFLRR